MSHSCPSKKYSETLRISAATFKKPLHPKRRVELPPRRYHHQIGKPRGERQFKAADSTFRTPIGRRKMANCALNVCDRSSISSVTKLFRSGRVCPQEADIWWRGLFTSQRAVRPKETECLQPPIARGIPRSTRYASRAVRSTRRVDPAR
jgi:hypothetical protein